MKNKSKKSSKARKALQKKNLSTQLQASLSQSSEYQTYGVNTNVQTSSISPTSETASTESTTADSKTFDMTDFLKKVSQVEHSPHPDNITPAFWNYMLSTSTQAYLKALDNRLIDHHTHDNYLHSLSQTLSLEEEDLLAKGANVYTVNGIWQKEDSHEYTDGIIFPAETKSSVVDQLMTTLSLSDYPAQPIFYFHHRGEDYQEILIKSATITTLARLKIAMILVNFPEETRFHRQKELVQDLKDQGLLRLIHVYGLRVAAFSDIQQDKVPLTRKEDIEIKTD